MNKEKITNTSKNRKKETKAVPWNSSIFSWREIPVSEGAIEYIINELQREGDENMKMYSLEKFLKKHKISHQTFDRWRQKFDRLEEAVQFFLMSIGVTREDLAIEGEIDRGMIIPTQAHYSKVWRDMEEWRAALKNKDDKKDMNITIEMPAYAKTDVVPERKHFEHVEKK